MTDRFRQWLSRLADRQGAMRISARIKRLESGNPGDMKAVAAGVFEMRIHTGPGYRVYYARKGQEIVILLVGGNKSSQKSDIDHAIRLAREFEAH